MKRPSLSCIPSLLLAVMFAGGCQTRDSTDQLADVDTSVQSWTQTIALAAKDWSDRAVPDMYIHQVIDSAQKAVKQQQTQLAKINAPDSQAGAVRIHLQKLTERIGRLTNAVEQTDRDIARQLVQEIETTPLERAR